MTSRLYPNVCVIDHNHIRVDGHRYRKGLEPRGVLYHIGLIIRQDPLQIHSAVHVFK